MATYNQITDAQKIPLAHRIAELPDVGGRRPRKGALSPSKALALWCKPTAAYRISDDVLLVLTPNTFIADWLTSKYSEMVQSLLPDGNERIRFAWMDFQPDKE